MKSGNIVDLSNLDRQDLIEELQKRGYMTRLLFCREDVEAQFDGLMQGYKGLEVKLTDEDKDNILDNLNTEWLCGEINDSIYNAVFDLFSEEIDAWDENDLGNKMRAGFGE